MYKEKLKELIKNKLSEIPHGVDFYLFKKTEVKRDSKFTFIVNKGWRGTSWDRGGVQYLIKAFNEEFTKDDNAELIVKLNPAYINQQALQQGINNLNLKPDRAEMKVFLNDIPPDKLYELYNMGDVYVCPSKSEAFDLGSAEAMACGLPVITTNYGGQIEHMNEDCALFTPYELVDVKEDIMYEEVKWANIDINLLRKNMRWCYKNQDKVKEMGIKAKKFISTFTWDSSARKIIEILSRQTHEL